MTHRVLVTDGEQRSALAVVRGLAAVGHTVAVGAGRHRSLAGSSRFSHAEWILPDPLREAEAYGDEVAALSRRHGFDVIVPISEAAMLAVLPRRAAMPGVRLPFPDVEVFRNVSDKQAVLSAAAGLGIATPQQRTLESPDAIDPDELRYPLVLKPSRSVADREGRRVKLGVEYASDARQFRDRIRRLDAAAYPVLLQQRVEGPGVGVFLLVWDGKIRAQFSHRRIREKPPSGGVSVYRESIPADPELVERSHALLAAFGWNGVAMVEYKVDAASRIPYLMEVNGRFWGSLQLAIDSGVNFPALLLDAADEVDQAPLTRYRTGVRSRWWWGDVDQLLSRLRHSRNSLDLPPDAPGRLAALAQFLILWRPGDRNEIFRFGDPGPFLQESIDWVLRR